MTRLLCAALLIAFVARIDAHPASDTSVVIAFHDERRAEISVAGDAVALATKLEALSRLPLTPSMPTGREALTARLTELGLALTSHVSIAIDDMRPRLSPGVVAVDDRGLATMHLEVELPANASTMTWSTDVMYGTYPLVIRGRDGRETIRWLDGRETTGPMDLQHAMAGQASFWSGIVLGFTHIVPGGLDHILFVLGLFLLGSASPAGRIRPARTRTSSRVRLLIGQVSAFTVAHSVTLGLSVYGVVAVPAAIVEPMIALSVAYVGVENLFTSTLRPWRVAIVLVFGLLHGLGFAGAMSALPYSNADLLGMLLWFNIGVELGQLSVIAAAALVLHLVLANRDAWQQPVARLASAAVGITGLVWTVDRIL
jgi:hypothetical protein